MLCRSLEATNTNISEMKNQEQKLRDEIDRLNTVDIPNATKSLELFAMMSNITWDTNSENVRGCMLTNVIVALFLSQVYRFHAYTFVHMNIYRNWYIFAKSNKQLNKQCVYSFLTIFFLFLSFCPQTSRTTPRRTSSRSSSTQSTKEQ